MLTKHDLPIQGGIYVFQLFDYFPVSRTIFVVAFCECMAIAYIYGMSNSVCVATFLLSPVESFIIRI